MVSGNRQKTRRIALLVQYDGTGYNGWQYQDNGRTIQSEIEYALKVLLKKHVRIVGSGRTDSGVHAFGQVAHFDVDMPIKLDKLCISLNGILPRDIAVVNAFNVPADFHARYNAVSREYKYLIYNYPQRSPFMMYRAMWVRELINEEFINEALGLLEGEHDFASFCKKISVSNGTVRRILSAKAARSDKIIEVTIEGNAFLHNMIRIIIGTVVELYNGRRRPEDIIEILDKKDRNFSGSTAPPYGLYLSKIKYEPSLSSMEMAF